MFAAVVEAGKLERALDLVERLHLEKSFDLAMKIADHHRKLVDLIEDAKDRRFGNEDDYDDDEDDAMSDEETPRDGMVATAGMDHQRITPDSMHRSKRAFDDIPVGDVKLGGNRRVRAKDVFA
jgi:chromosome transmission fidelity protein 4